MEEATIKSTADLDIPLNGSGPESGIRHAFFLSVRFHRTRGWFEAGGDSSCLRSARRSSAETRRGSAHLCARG